MKHYSFIQKPRRHALELLPTHVRDNRNVMRTTRQSRGKNGYYSFVRGTPRFLVTTKRNQRCVVKASYTKNTSTRSWAAHGEYLQREHAQTLGEKGVGFNDKSDVIDIKQALREWQQAGDEHVFKFIVSPENGHRIDLKVHAKELVAALAKDLKTELQWVAIDHHNTDHPHVHLVVRGLDANDNTLVIDSHYMMHEIRHRSEDLVTRELGLRREHDIKQSWQRQLSQEQVVSLDRHIMRRANERNIVSYDTPIPTNHLLREQRLLEIGRLQFLEVSGLAKRVGTKEWLIDDKLTQRLQELQRSNDINEAYAAHNIHTLTHELHTPTIIEHGNTLTGKVVGVGLENALTDKRYLLITDNNSKVHYVQATNSIVKAHDNFEFRKGDTITLERQSFVNEHNQVIDYIKVHTHSTNEHRLIEQTELQSFTARYQLQYPERAKKFEAEITKPSEKLAHELKQQQTRNLGRKRGGRSL